MTTDAWRTADELGTARRRFEHQLLGWVAPAAHGIVLHPGPTSAEPRVMVSNDGQHLLPAVVLATVLGRRNGTSTWPVSAEHLERAIELLAPAEAAVDFEHPNIAAWRQGLQEMRRDSTCRVYAVFVEDVSDEVTSVYDAALRDDLTRRATNT